MAKSNIKINVVACKYIALQQSHTSYTIAIFCLTIFLCLFYIDDCVAVRLTKRVHVLYVYVCVFVCLFA